MRRHRRRPCRADSGDCTRVVRDRNCSCRQSGQSLPIPALPLCSTGLSAPLPHSDVWDRCQAHAAPLRAIRMVDDTGRLVRAPEILFKASEIGLEEFGHNIENRFLLAALEQAARALPSLRWIADEATAVDIADRSATVMLKTGASVTAQLIVAADGHRSLCRSVAAIRTDARSYAADCPDLQSRSQSAAP